MQLKFIPVNEQIPYTAGQFVEAIFDDNKILPLSIANRPSMTGELEFHVRHNASYPMAQQFLAALSYDKKITFKGPLGDSTLHRAKAAHKMVFVAGGTGFTPLKALLEEAFCLTPHKEIALYWGIRKPQDAYKTELLERWQHQFPFFSYALVLSEPLSFPDWRSPCGLVHEYVASRYTHFKDEVVFVSGPFAMIKAAFSLFSTQGLTRSQFVSDMPVF